MSSRKRIGKASLPRVVLALLLMMFLPGFYSPTLHAQVVEDTLTDPEGDLVVVFPPGYSQEVNTTKYLEKTFLDVTRLTIVDYSGYKELVIETASPIDLDVLKSGQLEITVPIDYNGDDRAVDLVMIVGGIGQVDSLAKLVYEDGLRAAVVPNLTLSQENNKLIIRVEKQAIPSEYSTSWRFPRILENNSLAIVTYVETTVQGTIYVMDFLGTSASLTYPAPGYAEENTSNTITTVVAVTTTETSPTYPPAVSGLLETEPTDPTLQVEVTVSRLDVYQYFEDGQPYVALWMEATLGAPEAQDLEVHMIVEYSDGTLEEGTVIPGLKDMAKQLNQDPSYGLVFREWDSLNDRGGLIALIPVQPGDYSQARLLFGYIGPRENPRDISDITKVYLVVLAYRDKQAGLWNIAVDESQIRVVNAEPPDSIKDVIEEGKGLPRVPASYSTAMTTTRITINVNEEATATITYSATEESMEEGEYYEKEETGTASPSYATTTHETTMVTEHEEEEKEADTGSIIARNNDVEEREEEEQGAEEGEGESGESGEGEAEGEEGEGANLPTREIAIAIVIAAVAGVALSLVRKK